MDTELRNLFPKLRWDCKVKQLDKKDFLINIPSEEARDKLTLFKSFAFKSHPLRASVVESKMTEEAFDELTTLWVKMYGLPVFARSEAVVKALTKLMGNSESMDGESLRGRAPKRVQLSCKNLQALYYTLSIYINGMGYKIRWEPEGYPPKQSQKLPVPPKDGDDNGDDSDEEEKDHFDGDDKEYDKMEVTRVTSSHDKFGKMGGPPAICDDKNHNKGEKTDKEESEMGSTIPEVDLTHGEVHRENCALPIVSV